MEIFNFFKILGTVSIPFILIVGIVAILESRSLKKALFRLVILCLLFILIPSIICFLIWLFFLLINITPRLIYFIIIYVAWYSLIFIDDNNSTKIAISNWIEELEDRLTR
jgi:hypothetical protein